jgi:hypothetical protein
MKLTIQVCTLVVFISAALEPQKLGSQVTPDYASMTGSLFFPEPSDPFRTPQVRELKLPEIADAQSIWGSTGRDSRGHIWIGVSMGRYGTGAHLLELNPKTDTWIDHGSVIDQLRRVNLYEPGKGQVKIHSRIVQAGDGWLYFASTDEEGENPATSAFPKGGAHLWRIHPEKGDWEHLLATSEGIVAVSGSGRFIYALGYWNHILFQYDTETKQNRRIVVGSADGHVSRNFLADLRGHAFVPRIRKPSKKTYVVELVEYDEQLREIGATPLRYYLDDVSPEENHGIVGVAYMPNRQLMFTTHRGQVYAITPVEMGPAKITALGWMHPKGEAYAPGLYAFGGDTWLAGIVQRGMSFDWVVHNFGAGLSRSFRIDSGSLKEVLLYGSITTDDLGRIYAVGWALDEHRDAQRPLLLQIKPAR